jgi:hypothetical protein
MSLSDSASEDSMRTLYVGMKAFLESYGLSALDAQIIFEVCSSGEYYIDTRKLSKRLPRNFNVGSSALEKHLKDLIQSRFLSPYESKKDKFCARSGEFGRDFVRQALYEGFNSFEEFPLLEERFSKVKLMCYDPAGLKRGETRYASGPTGKKIKVDILDIIPSDEVWESLDDGRTFYAIRLVGNALCPQCTDPIPIDFSYTPNTCYYSFNEFQCGKCGFKFMLRCALDRYYT